MNYDHSEWAQKATDKLEEFANKFDTDKISVIGLSFVCQSLNSLITMLKYTRRNSDA